jgi:hypothetical protein
MVGVKTHLIQEIAEKMEEIMIWLGRLSKLYFKDSAQKQ